MVEEQLGHLLPTDFKVLAQTFGTGVYGRSVSVVSPVDGPVALEVFSDQIADKLNLAREWAADGVVPHALHPEPGGLIPWGETLSGNSLFWRTTAAAPDEWTVVCCDSRYTVWEEHPQGMAEFLLAFLRGESDSRLLGGRTPRERTGAPVFTPPAGRRRPVDALPGDVWDALFADVVLTGPANRVDDLATAVGAGPAGVRRDWTDVEERLSARFPADYKELIDRFGPGEFRGISVVATEAPDEFELFHLAIDVQDRIRERRPVAGAPFFPENGGAVPWAYTESGHVFFWAPRGDDPDEWPVFVVPPDFSGHIPFSRSASSLLLAHLTGQTDVAAVLGVDPGQPTFTSGQN